MYKFWFRYHKDDATAIFLFGPNRHGNPVVTRETHDAEWGIPVCFHALPILQKKQDRLAKLHQAQPLLERMLQEDTKVGNNIVVQYYNVHIAVAETPVPNRRLLLTLRKIWRKNMHIASYYRKAGDPMGKGNYWTVDPSCEKMLDNGNFRRRRRNNVKT